MFVIGVIWMLIAIFLGAEFILHGSILAFWGGIAALALEYCFLEDV